MGNVFDYSDYSDDDEYDDEDDFIDNDDAGASMIGITKVLRKITGYNPDAFDDRRLTDAQLQREMRANTRDIFDEERRALKMDKLESKKKGTAKLVDLESSDDDY